MSRIHITLVGGQPAPIYNAIVATEPEKVIFICSDDTKDICHSIQREIHIPSELKVLDPIDQI